MLNKWLNLFFRLKNFVKVKSLMMHLVKISNKEKKMSLKIALLSVADIYNYGDMLFPFLARNEIEKIYPDSIFRFFTPTECVIENEQFHEYSRDNIHSFSPDAIFVIGGDVIHKYNEVVWKDMYGNFDKKISDIIFGWYDSKAYKAWLSVGALDLELPMEEIADHEINGIDKICVRGILSKKLLENKRSCFINKKIEIIPDIGWIFPRFFQDYKNILKNINEKYNTSLLENNFICFTCNWTSIPEEKIENILDILYDFSQNNNLKICIFNCISTYKSLPFDLNTYSKNRNGIIYLENLDLKEMGSLLCGCRFYIGSSLHCAVTSLSSGKYSSVIHQFPLLKFQETFGHLMRTDLYSDNWDDIENILDKLLNVSEEELYILSSYIKFMQSVFDHKFKNVFQSVRVAK